MADTNLLPFRLDQPLALAENALHHLETRSQQYAAGMLSNERAKRPRSRQRWAVIPIHDVLLYFDSWMGTSMPRVGWAIDAAVATDDIAGIILDIDSPGGTVMGTPELYDRILAATDKKPVIAAVNPLAASAAYYVASAASEIYLTKSGEVGSIGVWTMHADQSGMMKRIGVDVSLVSAGRYKVEANPYEPLPDDARAEMQRGVNEAYLEFLKAVARGRGVSVATVKDSFGQGRMIDAKRAVRLGMVDGIKTFDEVLARHSKGSTVRQAQGDPQQTEYLQAAWNGEITVPPISTARERLEDIAELRAAKRECQPMLDEQEIQAAQDEAEILAAEMEAAKWR